MNHHGGHHGGGHHGGGISRGWWNWPATEYVPYPVDFSSDEIPWNWVAIGGLAGIVLALLVKR